MTFLIGHSLTRQGFDKIVLLEGINDIDKTNPDFPRVGADRLPACPALLTCGLPRKSWTGN